MIKAFLILTILPLFAIFAIGTQTFACTNEFCYSKSKDKALVTNKTCKSKSCLPHLIFECFDAREFSSVISLRLKTQKFKTGLSEYEIKQKSNSAGFRFEINTGNGIVSAPSIMLDSSDSINFVSVGWLTSNDFNLLMDSKYLNVTLPQFPNVSETKMSARGSKRAINAIFKRCPRYELEAPESVKKKYQ